MTEKKPEYVDGVGWRYELEHSMHRRMLNHDYQSRSIYMLTLCVEGRRNLLGELRFREQGGESQGMSAEGAYIEPTELGREVRRCWYAIHDFHPEVEVLHFQLMPDHIHGLLFVKHGMEVHLGKVVNGFKIGCNKAYRRLVQCPEAMRVGCPEAMRVGCPEAMRVGCPEAMPQETKQAQPPLPRARHSRTGMLFEPGYQDSVLMGKDQLENMFRYISDNPRRLAVKRMNPDLFRVVASLTIGGQTFAAIGNRYLLDRPVRMQVRCHNNTTDANLRLIEKQKEYFLDRARKGGVVVSPCISAGEKEIARALLDARLPLVVVLENGFPPMYKPPGQYFDACADGRLLMLAPWPYHMEKRTITRQQCLALNEISRQISTEPWTRELEEGFFCNTGR